MPAAAPGRPREPASTLVAHDRIVGVLDDVLVPVEAVVSMEEVVTNDVVLEAVCFDPPEWQATTNTLEATSATSRGDVVGRIRTVWVLSC